MHSFTFPVLRSISDIIQKQKLGAARITRKNLVILTALAASLLFTVTASALPSKVLQGHR